MTGINKQGGSALISATDVLDPLGLLAVAESLPEKKTVAEYRGVP